MGGLGEVDSVLAMHIYSSDIYANGFDEGISMAPVQLLL